MNCECWYNPETGQREYCATHEAEVRAQPPSEAKEQPSFPAQSNALPTVPYVAPAVGFVPIGTPVSTVKPAVQPWMEATAKEYCGDSVSFTYKRTHLIEVLTRLAPAPAPDETGRNLTDNYVAWLTFEHHSGNRVSIHVCDSDTKGAFKVYRHAPAPPPDVTRLVEAARDTLLALPVLRAILVVAGLHGGDIAQALEDKLRAALADGDLEKFQTVGDVIAYLKERVE